MSKTKVQFTFVFSTAHRLDTFEGKKYCRVNVLEVLVASRGICIKEKNTESFNSLQLIIWFVYQLVIHTVRELY